MALGGRLSPTQFGTVLLKWEMLLDGPVLNEKVILVIGGGSGRIEIQFPGISLPAEPALALG